MKTLKIKVPLTALLLALSLLPTLLLATVGEPLYIQDIFFDAKSGEILYIINGGYSLQLRRLSVQTGLDEIVLDTGDEGETEIFSQKRNELKSRYPVLKEVDLKAVGLGFKTEFIGGKNHLNPDGTVNENNYVYQGPGSVHLRWRATALHNQTSVGIGEILSCPENNSVSFRGYSLPGERFVFLVTTSVALCFEGGYIYEAGFLARDIPITADVILPHQVGPVTETRPKSKIPGRIYATLSEGPVSKFLNETGFQAYKEKKYAVAREYFTAASSWNMNIEDSLLPLYNLACTQALLGDTNGSIASLRKILSHRKTRNRYVEKIKKDADFDRIRDDAEFIELLK